MTTTLTPAEYQEAIQHIKDYSSTIVLKKYEERTANGQSHEEAIQAIAENYGVKAEDIAPILPVGRKKRNITALKFFMESRNISKEELLETLEALED